MTGQRAPIARPRPVAPAPRSAAPRPAPAGRAAEALRTLAWTARPVDAAGSEPSSPVAEALHRLGALGHPEGARPPAPAAAARPERTRAEPGDPRISQLSSAERRVVVLAADGFCNREISRRLFITVSTVEQHLTRAYRKLGVKSRGELPPTGRRAAARG